MVISLGVGVVVGYVEVKVDLGVDDAGHIRFSYPPGCGIWVEATIGGEFHQQGVEMALGVVEEKLWRS